MIELLVTRQGDHLVPYDSVASEDIASLPSGPLMVKVTKKRSVVHNRFYFVCLGSIVKAGGAADVDSLHKATKIKCGLVKMCTLPNGDFLAFPDSTAFDKMDQIAFNTFFPKAVDFWRASGLYAWLAPDLRLQLEKDMAT